jgi:hypothetical protein
MSYFLHLLIFTDVRRLNIALPLLTPEMIPRINKIDHARADLLTSCATEALMVFLSSFLSRTHTRAHTIRAMDPRLISWQSIHHRFDISYREVTGFIRPHTISFIVCLMVFNATFNNISVISWRSVLLV